ncbi:cytochrome P450 [Vitreoscilla sp. C1]|uniref:cytochrome P450 n=1 Tax=Vitreoscilla sp. (strain C1) TaxID=96942 RepID=UPI00148ED640|nr:cytochrome P450 [Vitreoscilla sp. C1]AUZ05665.2 cytochrome P450 [Vitreoscilla sp. C1]
MDNSLIVEVPFLNFADPSFSIRSDAVKQAQDVSWYAKTPYGLAILRYDEVNALVRDQRLRQGSYAWPKHCNATGAFADWWTRMLLSKEGPNHSRLRRLANPAFSPKLVRLMQPVFFQLANDLINQFIDQGKCEFVGDFAAPYATQVICCLLGIPLSEAKRLAELAVDMGVALGVTYERDQNLVNGATDEMFEYCYEAVRRLKEEGLGDNFLSMLVKANENQADLSDEELFDMMVLAIFGGIDTTRNQLSLAMDTFVQNPAQWQILGEQPDLAANAVEEIMRFRPTVTWVTREALEDFEFQGVFIKQGTTVHLISQAADNDPRAFGDVAFDITQKRKAHFGFGAGAHHCIGHFIARGDMKEALALLAQRLHNVQYAAEPSYMPDSGNTGLNHLHIRFDAVKG